MEIKEWMRIQAVEITFLRSVKGCSKTDWK
jgi:hypothetical protein